MSAEKKNEGKLEWSLIDMPSFEELVRVLEFGKQKYSRDNWKKGRPWLEIYDATLRHLVSWREGEDIDPESGLSHLAHAQANLMFLIYFKNNLQQLDNRKNEIK